MLKGPRPRADDETMRRSLTIAAGLATAALVAGCGGSSKQHGFYNMRSLSTDIKVQIGSRALDGGQPNDVAKSVVCLRSGKQTATCNVRLDSGWIGTLSVTISPSGDRYVTHVV